LIYATPLLYVKRNNISGDRPSSHPAGRKFHEPFAALILFISSAAAFAISGSGFSDTHGYACGTLLHCQRKINAGNCVKSCTNVNYQLLLKQITGKMEKERE